MAVPASRTEFKEYCLRKLGKPVIEINVDDDQVDDRVDEALKYYWDYHFDGTDKTYYKYQVTPTDITNKYITIPENIIGEQKKISIGYNKSKYDCYSVNENTIIDRLNELYNILCFLLLCSNHERNP